MDNKFAHDEFLMDEETEDIDTFITDEDDDAEEDEDEVEATEEEEEEL